MKKLLMAGLAVGMLTMGAPLSPAQADGLTYVGGCGFATLNDTTPGGQLGGQDVWNGAVRLAVIPTTAGVPNGSAVSASCELKVNGVSQGTVLSATGTGFAFNAGQIQFTAAITDIVSMCTHVTSVNGTEVVCADATTTQIIPQPVIDLLELVGDPLVCAVLIAAAPTVNSTVPSSITYIDPATGDWFLLGTSTPDNLFWDCPPYIT